MSLTHEKVAETPDDPEYEVGTDEWNAAHVQSGAGMLGRTDGAGATGLLDGAAVLAFAGAAASDHDHDADYDALGAAAAAQAAAEATASAALTAHAGAADPHTGYQKESEKGAANGYASLDGDGKVPSAQLPAAGGGAAWGDISGTLSDQTDLQTALDGKSSTSHDHDADYEASGAVAAHAGAADPHTGYQKESEKDAASGYCGLDANSRVNYARIQNVSATSRVLGRRTAGAGAIEEMTLSQVLDLVASAADGDILYRAGGAWTRLAKGTDGHVLTLASGVPSWAAAAGGGGGPTKISGNTGAFAADTTWLTLTSNSADITSTTQTVVMTLTGVAAGTYRLKATLIFQAAATTTGIGITLNHTGTVSRFVSNWMHITTGGAAATGISDQSTATQAGQMMEGKAERAKDTRSSFTIGVDSANADQLAVMDALIIVTASGDVQLKIATEVNASAVRLMAGSTLELHKTV